MTSIALNTFFTGVHIIGFVAVQAFAAQRFVTQFAPMAYATQQILMAATQRKLRLPVMIKPDFFPATGLVTGFAFTTVLSTVLVIIPVAGNALHAEVYIHQISTVAGIAFHLAVSAC
jgi:hypothetical protein